MNTMDSISPLFSRRIGYFSQNITNCSTWKGAKVNYSRRCSGRQPSKNVLSVEQPLTIFNHWRCWSKLSRVDGNKPLCVKTLQNCAREMKSCSVMETPLLEKS